MMIVVVIGADSSQFPTKVPRQYSGLTIVSFLDFRGEHRTERAQYKMVGCAQVPRVGRRRRIRQQVRRATGGPGSAVHARR